MISKTIKRTIEVETPIAFTCDICGYTIELTSDFDIKYESDIKKHMAVVNFNFPAGGFRQDIISSQLHCCSAECVCKAIKKVPFDAIITIPISSKFKK